MNRMSVLFNGTTHSSYILDSYYEHYRKIFEAAIAEINEGLKEYSNFDGVDFSDVGANGIQIRGHHKEIKGRTYGTQPTIKYDLSNITDTVSEFIEMWKQEDTTQKVNDYKRFLELGDKYGWD